jgi:hypothetical protein
VNTGSYLLEWKKPGWKDSSVDPDRQDFPPARLSPLQKKLGIPLFKAA